MHDHDDVAADFARTLLERMRGFIDGEHLNPTTEQRMSLRLPPAYYYAITTYGDCLVQLAELALGSGDDDLLGRYQWHRDWYFDHTAEMKRHRANYDETQRRAEDDEYRALAEAADRAVSEQAEEDEAQRDAEREADEQRRRDAGIGRAYAWFADELPEDAPEWVRHAYRQIRRRRGRRQQVLDQIRVYGRLATLPARRAPRSSRSPRSRRTTRRASARAPARPGEDDPEPPLAVWRVLARLRSLLPVFGRRER